MKQFLRAIPAIVAVLVLAWISSKAVPPRDDDGAAQIRAFGELPVVFQGRVKPFDTLARNSLVILSDRQTFVDANGDRQPAIRWLLDVISQSEAAEKHKVFRIENLLESGATA